MIAGFLMGAAIGALGALGYARAFAARRRAPAAAAGRPRGEESPARSAAAGQATEGVVASPARLQVRRALETVAVNLGARRAILWDVHLAHDLAHATAVTAGDRPPDIGLEGDPLRWAVKEGMPLRLDTAQRWSRGGNGCAVRLRPGGGAGCLLTLEFAVEADLPQLDDLTVWGAYVDAFVRAEIYQAEATFEREQGRALLEVLKRLPAAEDLPSFAAELAEAARLLARVDGAAVAGWHGERGELLAVAGDVASVPTPARFRSAESVLGLVAVAGEEVARDHWRGDPQRLPVLAPGERWGVPPRAAGAFPLLLKDRGAEEWEPERRMLGGMVSIWSIGEETISDESREAVRTILPYAALDFARVKAYGQFREESRFDALTSLPNRRAFEERLAREERAYGRHARPFAVIMLDIDHFKLVNDTYGHDAGDAVLRAIGKLLLSALREGDLPARLGGEEFAILLPETTLDAALDTAERLRARLQAMPVSWQGGIIPVTASFGVAAVPECVVAAASLLESADAALYASKHAGRNRVSAAAPVGR